MADQSTAGDTARPPNGAKPRHRDRTHSLGLAVIVAAVAGIVVGLAAPGVGKSLAPLGTGFVNLIKMMISPIIFCTIVLGVGSVRQAAKVGKACSPWCTSSRCRRSRWRSAWSSATCSRRAKG